MNPSAETLKIARATASVCAQSLRLPLRALQWSGQSGNFAGAGTGASLDFHDHRLYSPGDDPRHLNWQAYARTGQYTMKLFREETQPLVDLFFDISPSMFFEPEKEKRSLELFFFLSESTRRAGAHLRTYFLANQDCRLLPPEALNGDHWLEIARDLTKNARPDQPEAPQLGRHPLRPKALRVLLSDLLFPGDPAHVINPLVQGNGHPLIFRPFSQSEANPAWDGNHEFIDAENASRHPRHINPQALREYKSTYQRHFDYWQDQARRHRIPFASLPAEPPLHQTLLQHALPLQALENAI